jgi:hypothetical protein
LPFHLVENRLTVGWRRSKSTIAISPQQYKLHEEGREQRSAWIACYKNSVEFCMWLNGLPSLSLLDCLLNSNNFNLFIKIQTYTDNWQHLNNLHRGIFNLIVAGTQFQWPSYVSIIVEQPDSRYK